MKKRLTVIFVSVMVIGISVLGFVTKDSEYSMTERRNLTSLKELKKDFRRYVEDYTADQFPLRDTFRSIKAYISQYGLNMGDNNGFYKNGDYISKMDNKLNLKHLNNNYERFMKIVRMYQIDKAYISIIPDKNYFMNHPTYDYDELIKIYKETGFEYIDIFDELKLEDYYYTDQHFKQNEVIDVADVILEKLNHVVKDDTLSVKNLEIEFSGVYALQSALPYKSDMIEYLESDIINNLKAYDYENNEIRIYDFDKAMDKDPYEFFLEGNNPLVFIENDMADNDDTLVIFRDSFGSSIGPLLARGYKKTVLVDLRLINEELLGEYIDFNECDVLFLYSTLILNSVG